MLTDAQELLRNREHFPATRKVKPLPDGFIDPARSLDENQKWSKYYRETFNNQAR
jgi:hypothetical protein